MDLAAAPWDRPYPIRLVDVDTNHAVLPRRFGDFQNYRTARPPPVGLQTVAYLLAKRAARQKRYEPDNDKIAKDFHTELRGLFTITQQLLI